MAQVDEAGRVRWLPLPDPSARDLATRSQVAESTAFLGGEGIWYREGVVYFVTKLDQKVWMYSTVDETLSVLYEPALVPEPPLLTGPDNIVMSSFGDLLVCEDHTGEQEIVLITADGEIAPLLRLTGQNAAELTGPAFSPGGDRLYFSSQRGGDGGGITYEVRGPFRHTEPVTTTSASAATTTPTTIADALSRNEQRRTEETEPGGGDDDFPVVPAVGGAVVAAGLLAGGIALARRRASSRSEDEPGTS
ncbi:MAG: DUF839 domain-containing protein [Acidimicrobiia bacterium]|nr:DUF839 domain-containing protein [Acidimicrobiia bacterium]